MTSIFRWPWQRREPECNEALAAKIESQIQRKTAEQQRTEARAQADRIVARNARNHYIEDLNRAFQRGHA